MKRTNRIPSAGFALIITLIMLALAAVISVALLTNASIDRATATSFNQRFAAEVAAQNGLEAAKKALIASPNAGSAITADDGFLVLRVDGTQANSKGTKDAYYYLARAQSGTANQLDCYPLFSGGVQKTVQTDLTKYPIATLPTPPPSPMSSPAEETFGSTTKRYPALFTFQQPAYTQWQEIRDPNDPGAGSHTLPYQRYTFWIEDMEGYVDGTISGNTADGGANKRPLDQSSAAKRYQSTPGEIALFTIFDTAAAPDPGTTAAKTLIQDQPLLFTVPTFFQLAPGPSNADVTSPVLAARIQPDLELPLVPYGYGYKDEGDATNGKVDINKQVGTGGASAVQAIAKKINDNLPNFGNTRKGGLTSLNYVNTLAASIIDYADTDSDATVGSDYRGVDSYPLVNEYYTMKWWTKTYQQSGTYWVEVTLDTWVELWNPTNQTISGSATLKVMENHPVQAGTATYTFGTGTSDLGNGSTVAQSYPSGQTLTINMQPNEYAALHYEHDVFQLNTGVAPPLIFPASGVNSMPLSASMASNYQFSFTGQSGSPQIVDKAGGGMQRISGTLKGPPSYIASNKNWRGSYPGFAYNDNANNSISPYNNMGDPRCSYHMGAGQGAIAYDQGSSFWVRNNRSNVASSQIYSAVRPAAWAEGGHDTKTVVTAPGSNSTADPPTSRPASATTEITKGPDMISNAGVYYTTAEFGNIYDPGMWNIPPDTSSPPSWAHLSSSNITAASQASANYGGGITLHIGRPEFTLFDKPGTRAWQILDLFHPGPRIDTHGQVNINTASRDALRALGAGLLMNRDPDILPAGNRFPPFQSAQADLFADAVIKARPFLSTAQLAWIQNTAGTGFFGNPATWSSAPPTEWNDAAAQEYFAKVLPLATVHSRNFRVFVTGQSLDKNGRTLSTVSRVYQLFLTPTRDPNGKITSQSATLTYEAQLPLL